MSDVQLESRPGWECVHLKEIAEIASGVAKGRRFNGAMTVTVPYLRVANVQAGHLDLSEIKEIEVLPTDIEKCRLRPGDVLMTEGGDRDKLGRGTIWQGEVETCIHQNHVFRVRPNRTRLLPEYLSLYLGTPEAKSYFLRAAKQTTGIASINMTQLSAFPVSFPSVKDQRRIAAILDKADAIRRKREEGIRLTGELLRSTFLEMFGDPTINSRRWPTTPLGTVAQLDRGRSRHRPRDEPSLYGGPYPFIQTGDVSNSDGYISEFTQTYSESGLAQSKLWPEGTLCITIAANIAKTAILSIKACFPDSLVGLIVGERLTIEYVRFWFVVMEKIIDAAATQVAQKNINLEILNKLTIPVPPLPLQRRFSQIVGHIYGVKKVRSDAVQASGDLFDSLVQRAFRGEL